MIDWPRNIEKEPFMATRKRLLRMKDVCEILDVSRTVVESMIANGDLRAGRTPGGEIRKGAWRFKQNEVNRARNLLAGTGS